MKNILLAATLSAGAFASLSNANTFGLYDDTFSLFNGETAITSGVFEARWGSWDGSLFTPYLGNNAVAGNSGYIDIESPELVANLSQGDNNNVPVGASLFLALTLIPDDGVYVSSNTEAILTDPSWVAPTFVFLENPFISAVFSQNTTAVKGQFSFNGGNEIINLVIPEPSSFAAIAGLAVVGMAATRRRRSA